MVSMSSICNGDRCGQYSGLSACAQGADWHGQIVRKAQLDGNNDIRDIGSEDDARLNWLDEQEQQQEYRGRVQYQYYSNGNGIASRGNLEDTDIDFNYVAVSAAYPAPTPNAYTVTGHSETLETIALQFWGDASLWYLIADANGLSGPRNLSVGQTLLIPNQVANVRNAADTFKPYNPSKIIGDVTPTLPLAPPAKQGCTAAQILVVAIAVVATVFTAGAAAAVLAPGLAGGMAAVGGAVLTGAGGLGGLAAAAIGGAVGSMAGQLANGILTGAEVSGSSLMKGALQGGLAAAGGSLLMGAGGGFRLPGSNWASIAGNMTLRAVSNPAVAAYMGSYSAGKITNSGESFSWSALAASVVGAGLAGAVTGVSPGIFGSTQGANFGQRVASGLISGASGATMQRMFNKGGKQQWGEIAANAFGQALGNSLVRYASDPGYRRDIIANLSEALGVEKPLSFIEQAQRDALQLYASLNEFSNEMVDAGVSGTRRLVEIAEGLTVEVVEHSGERLTDDDLARVRQNYGEASRQIEALEQKMDAQLFSVNAMLGAQVYDAVSKAFPVPGGPEAELAALLGSIAISEIASDVGLSKRETSRHRQCRCWG
jgi:hypothetical protein